MNKLFSVFLIILFFESPLAGGKTIDDELDETSKVQCGQTTDSSNFEDTKGKLKRLDTLINLLNIDILTKVLGALELTPSIPPSIKLALHGAHTLFWRFYTYPLKQLPSISSEPSVFEDSREETFFFFLLSKAFESSTCLLELLASAELLPMNTALLTYIKWIHGASAAINLMERNCLGSLITAVTVKADRKECATERKLKDVSTTFLHKLLLDDFTQGTAVVYGSTGEVTLSPKYFMKSIRAPAKVKTGASKTAENLPTQGEQEDFWSIKIDFYINPKYKGTPKRVVYDADELHIEKIKPHYRDLLQTLSRLGFEVYQTNFENFRWCAPKEDLPPPP